MVVIFGLMEAGKKKAVGRNGSFFKNHIKTEMYLLQEYTPATEENPCSRLFLFILGFGGREPAPLWTIMPYQPLLGYFMGCFLFFLVSSASEQSDDDPVCPGAGVGAEHGTGQAICLALL